MLEFTHTCHVTGNVMDISNRLGSVVYFLLRFLPAENSLITCFVRILYLIFRVYCLPDFLKVDSKFGFIYFFSDRIVCLLCASTLAS